MTTNDEYYAGMIEGVLDGFALRKTQEIPRTSVSACVKGIMSVVEATSDPKTIPGPKMTDIMESWGARNDYKLVSGTRPKLVRK
jgi:hypothetical protein